MGADTVIDWDYIVSLRQMQEPNEPDVVGELVRLFLEDSQACLAQAQAAVASGNHLALGRAAHRLRGSASLLRARRLASVTEAVEAAAESRLGSLTTLLADLDAAVVAVQTALRAASSNQTLSASASTPH